VWRRHQAYGLTFHAENPWWLGDPVVAEYPYAVPGAGLFPGPPFTIGAVRSTVNATVVNPGDVPAYPTWRITGPFTGFTVGVGDSVVSMTYTRTGAGWVDVNMDPRHLSITNNVGADLWDNLTDIGFGPIPPGDVPLVTTLAGGADGSSVALTFEPRYWRAL
jgi:hypothetical protein